MLTTASDGCGMEYPQKVTRGLRDNGEREERRLSVTEFASARPVPTLPLFPLLSLTFY